MRVAITGASGFIGRHLVQRLLNEGLPSLSGDRTSLQLRILASSEGGMARCKALWPEVESRLLHGPEGSIAPDVLAGTDVVVHMGWSSVPAIAEKDPQLDLTLNVSTGLRMLDAISAAGVQRVIFLSSGGTVYGPQPEMPITEKVLARPNTAYGISKLLFEQYLRLHAQRNGMESIVLRPGNVYGDPLPRIRPQGVIEHWLACIATDRPIELWNDLSVTRDFIHIDDMVKAIMLSLTVPANDLILNVGTGVGTSLGRLLDLLPDVTGREVRTDVHGASPAIIPQNILDTGEAGKQLNFRPAIELRQGLSLLWQRIATDDAFR